MCVCVFLLQTPKRPRSPCVRTALAGGERGCGLLFNSPPKKLLLLLSLLRTTSEVKAAASAASRPRAESRRKRILGIPPPLCVCPFGAETTTTTKTTQLGREKRELFKKLLRSLLKPPFLRERGFKEARFYGASLSCFPFTAKTRAFFRVSSSPFLQHPTTTTTSACAANRDNKMGLCCHFYNVHFLMLQERERERPESFPLPPPPEKETSSRGETFYNIAKQSSCVCVCSFSCSRERHMCKTLPNSRSALFLLFHSSNSSVRILPV